VSKLRAKLRAATGREPSHADLALNRFTSTEDGFIEFVYSGTDWQLDPARGE
jgi:hypothetical protein